MKSLENNDLHKILFLDIETVPAEPSFSKLSPTVQNLWAEKTKWQRKDDVSAEDFYSERGGILAEFSKIICISVGYIPTDATDTLKVTSYYGDDETEILENFATLLNNYFTTQLHSLCAHNGKEFDFPVIARRMIINGIKLPYLLDISGKKPWEISLLDTMELWKFGDYKHNTSIKLLTHVLNIPSPKDDISGKDVADVYYKEKDIGRIVKYCEKDTLAVAQIVMKYLRKPLLKIEVLPHV